MICTDKNKDRISFSVVSFAVDNFLSDCVLLFLLKYLFVVSYMKDFLIFSHKNKVFGLSYQQILKLMQQEFQERNILDSQSKPVV